MGLAQRQHTIGGKLFGGFVWMRRTRHWGPFWMVCARGPMTLHLRESTIYEQFDSRDVAAIVGCEKHDGFRSLIGRSEPSERNAVGDHLSAFLAYL